MSIRNLDKVFRPHRIAVVGASRTAGSVGDTVMRNLIGSDFGGVVYPVNPNHEGVHGIPAYPEVAALPRPADLAVVCTPAKTVPEIVRQCGEAGVKGVVILSAGFREVGDEGKTIEDRIRDEWAKFPELRIIGPNCLGIIAPGAGLNASFAAATPARGRVAFVSQSGALCTSVLDRALEEGLGFSYFVSIGNMLDVDFGDLIDFFGEDPSTESIIFYAESVTDARKFMSATRAFTLTKPIVAYKAGRFAASAKAAASHTGAMAGEDSVYDAAFQRAGIERAFEIEEVFDCAELLARFRRPRGARLAIVTNAGGPGVIATDALLERRGELASLSEKTLQQLDEQLPPYWSHGNPIDVLGDATPERYRHATEAVLQDDGVDAVLILLTPQAMTDPTQTAAAVGELAAGARKPILAAWMGGLAVQKGIDALNRANVPTYTVPEQAVNAFMHLVSYARNREILYETPRDIPVRVKLNREQIRESFKQTLAQTEGALLTEPDAKTLLASYGIPVTKAVAARSPEEAASAADEAGYPVVLKVLSPEITHKSDVGGVVLNIRNAGEARDAYEQIRQAARREQPEARVDGVTVQPMASSEHGMELILGAKQDPTFGSVILAGTGGTAAELFRDRALGLPPLTERLARRMLESLRSWPLLTGYRGRLPVDIDALIETLIRFSYLVTDHPEIAEFDINPLLVTPQGVTGLDARATIDREVLHHPAPPYAHLAIRPYPRQYVRQDRMDDGTAVLLRPIRPEDEPMWHTLLAACSPDSIRSRFRSLFRTTTHEMATRYCFIDYDREMAIVAELEDEGERKLVGVGRLIADPDHEGAEYAVLVADPWQNRGLGSKLTGYCVEIARDWGLQEVTAVTDWHNRRMLAAFREHGFELRDDEEENTVVARKDLSGHSARSVS